ncbi:MAG: phosphoribosylformylglycinamidine cyclo-ligase [Acidimicrobiales bacterium]
MPETYAGAGVDIAAGDKAVALIKEAVRSTYRSEVVGDIGGFGGLFALRTGGYAQPVLVASTDGVGTKAMVASALGRYDTVGIDMVAMTVDDIACQGAEPLFVLEGCRRAGAALLGGEMAEHPGTMADGEFDLSGTAVGVVDQPDVLGPDRVRPGNVLIGLGSPGLRCNGLSLARRVYLEVAGRNLADAAWDGAEVSVGEVLLEPSVIYSPALRALAGAIGPGLHAAAHITGGGLVGNVPRMLGPDSDARLEWGTWVVPPVFGEIQRLGEVEWAEMARVFNLGLGMVVAVAPGRADEAVASLRAAGVVAVVVGEVVAGQGRLSDLGN